MSGRPTGFDWEVCLHPFVLENILLADSLIVSLLLHCTHRDQRPHRHVVTGCDGIKSCAWKQGFVWHGHGPRLSKTIFIVAMYRPRSVLQSIVFKGANPTQSEFRIVQHGSFSVHDVGLQSCFLEICFHKQQIDNCIGMY